MSCRGLAGHKCLLCSHYHLRSNGRKYFSRLAPIGPQIAKKSRSYFHEAVFWRQTYVVDICGGRICGLQCLAIASQQGGGWGQMGISQLRYRYHSCAEWNCDIPIRPQPLHKTGDCNIDIAAAISPFVPNYPHAVTQSPSTASHIFCHCKYPPRKFGTKIRLHGSRSVIF